MIGLARGSIRKTVPFDNNCGYRFVLLICLSFLALMISGCSLTRPDPRSMSKEELRSVCCRAFKTRYDRSLRYRVIGECWEKGYFGVVDKDASDAAYAKAGPPEKKSSGLDDPFLLFLPLAIPLYPIGLVEEELGGGFDAPRICFEE